MSICAVLGNQDIALILGSLCAVIAITAFCLTFFVNKS